MFMQKLTFLAVFLVFAQFSFAQSLPKEVHFSADGKRLVTGGNVTTGLYDEAVIDTIELVFPQANYLTLLSGNYQSETPIPATLIYKGKSYDSVGVNYKGFTSYSMNSSQKKSFSIALDWVKGNQDINGYTALNLNCNFEDHSAMHEVLFNHVGRNYVPGLKSNYTYLKINGAPWALYANTQQLDGEFIKEWFQSNDGIRWRALKPGTSAGGGGMGGGSPFGTGFSSLNYLGADTTAYKAYYTLKKSGVDNPWDYLRDATNAIANMPASVQPDSLGYYVDVDKVLWFLAHEIAFGDDDGYVFKGGMDYFVYYEPESGTLFPLEFDGNSAFWPQASTWSPFYRETDTKFALCNKLFKVPEFRQRYLAHLRTIVQDHMEPTQLHAQVDTYKNLIDNAVQNEPKKIYTYAQFTAGVTTLKTWINSRYNFLKANAEVAQVAPVIESLVRSVNGTVDLAPTDVQTVSVTSKVTATSGVSSVWLYFSDRLVGRFNRVEMFDDGAHGDGAATDGTFGASIPTFSAGSYVRYYVEARANNTAKSVSFFPKGAEHDVFIYQVQFQTVAGEVVINEIMASNLTTAADENQQYDDWVELYNKSNTTVDISKYHITDKPDQLSKWDFPNMSILPNEYVILWCDEDSSQGPLHVNFKLSNTGEQLYLVDGNLAIVDQVTFTQQQTDRGYARRPNGTGGFVIQSPTFRANNDVIATHEIADNQRFMVFPNPSQGALTIETVGESKLQIVEVLDAQGRVLMSINNEEQNQLQLDLNALPKGLYFIQVNHGAAVQKLVKM
jgi:spore coat protein CotH